METFHDHIKRWVNLDNKHNSMKQEIKTIRSEKNNLKDTIYNYAENHNLEDAKIELSDGHLKLQKTKYSSPLTFKFLETCLNDCISDEDRVKQLIKYVKQKREINESYDIKRVYKK
jgi:hypothetical protein